MQPDTFFTQDNCDRCGQSLKNGRMMSWFNNQTICTDKCAKEETALRSSIRSTGDTNSYEGCGFIPVVQDGKVISPSR